MLGNLIGSIVIGVAVAIAMYFVYGMQRFKDQVMLNRTRSAITIGAVVAVVGFLLRWMTA